jgi:enamine deaminase RidA (YjgF/YER057c/UK114 family)
MYENLHRLLRAQGAGPGDVLTEKVFFSDVDRQFHALQEVRRACYNGLPEAPGRAPATIFLHQPPCHPGRLCELQAHAVIAAGGAPLSARAVGDAPGMASGRVVERRGRLHLYLMNLTGEGSDFSAQAENMFVRADACLRQEGFSFRDVIRTWFYIDDIEGDYAAFNRERTRFYREREVLRLPASTGIQGGTYPRRRSCAMDLYALKGSDRSPEVGVMRAPTLNEAPAYGSAFSRGMRVALEDRVTLYVSGTASIDAEGRVVHVGDVEGQLRRMFLNVEQLLAGQGATVGDAVSAITYLKRPEYLDAFHRVRRERSVPDDIPNTVSVADICRPEWLCEIEVMAVCPKSV